MFAYFMSLGSLGVEKTECKAATKYYFLNHIAIYVYFAQDSWTKVQAYAFIPLLFDDKLTPDLPNEEGRWKGG